ncbi:M48 family metallopeptidase [Marinimicrobium sp. C2-29]|uniref:M48 family metallopeptidase n=1 Tax=Marinimicrobium sp. C2-29 TaxID=3139825 RepID=UPI0031387F5E
MDFFEHQELARRATRRLVLLMALAVLALIALTTVLFAVVTVSFGATDTVSLSQGNLWTTLTERVGWQTLAWISALIGLGVLGGSLFKWLQLRGGGRAVAESLGGQLIPGNTQQYEQRRLLNIVEEMAIASGMPVPPVYLLDEPGINAFAAGHGPHDAVIGITRGSLEQLNRDELQGVIAHEFSHILHGDMRLNLRLVAILNGILIIGLLGYMLMRGGVGYSVSRRRRDGRIALLGLGLVVLGFVGTFFGRWIKAAVSRQREFLADASAVQYTRNPSGIGGALQKIGGAHGGSKMQASDAEEFSHMYFSEGGTSALSGLMATHPPLEQRIKRVMPQWDGEFPTGEPDNTDGLESGSEPPESQSSQRPDAQTIATAVIAGASIAQGDIQPEQLEQARQLLKDIPESLREAARDPFAARGVLLGLLLAEDESLQQAQWQELAEVLEPKALEALKPIILESQRLPETERLPAIELAMPALKELSTEQRRDYLKALDGVIRADDKVNLREWILYRIALHNLGQTATGRQRLKLQHCRDETRLLLSIAAMSGARASADAAHKAFEAGCQSLEQQWELMPSSQISLAQMDRALDRLTQLRPLEKPLLLKALKLCFEEDERITPTEAELYRAVADALDCPTPPLAPTDQPRG